MSNLAKLKTIKNSVSSDRYECELLQKEMTDNQKETWNVQVICFLKQAERNLEKIIAKAKAKVKKP